MDHQLDKSTNTLERLLSDDVLPIAFLPDYVLIRVMSYLQGIYKPTSGPPLQGPQSRNWRNRTKFVIRTSLDADWYKPYGPITGINYTNELLEILDLQLKWTSLCALRLTCRKFASLSAKVTPIFSLLRELHTGVVSTGPTATQLSTSSTSNASNAVPLVTHTELQLVDTSGTTSGSLKPHLFRTSQPPQDLLMDILQGNMREFDENAPPSDPALWYGMQALYVHQSFRPLYIPPPMDAPLSALQLIVSAQRHYTNLSIALTESPVEDMLMRSTTIDYFLGGEWRKKMEEDSETHVRFRLKVVLKGDEEMDAPPRFLHFKSVVTQSTSFIRPRSESDIQRDPLNLSPLLLRKTVAPALRALHVGFHTLCVETEDPILAAALELPAPTSRCSKMIVMIENGARGIMEMHTRQAGMAPVTLISDTFLSKLGSLLGFRIDTPPDILRTNTSILRWLSALSLVDYTLTGASPGNPDLLYSYSFLRHESPVTGPKSPSSIVNSNIFHLEPALQNFLGRTLELDHLSTTHGASHYDQLPDTLLISYYRSLDCILERYRWKHIVLPIVEKKARAELDPSLHMSLATLCSRTRIVGQVEVDLQLLEYQMLETPKLTPMAMHTAFEIATDTPNIFLRFTHRRYAMALSISVVAPTTLDAWQWAIKHRLLLNFFHLGYTPYFVPMPDLPHPSPRSKDIISIALLPTVSGAPQPPWTSDPLITNATLASTSVNSLDDLESRDSMCFFRWDPSVPLEEWRSTTAQQQTGLPIDLQLIESLTSVLGVPELSCNQFMTILIRVFGQLMGDIPATTDTKAHASPDDSPSPKPSLALSPPLPSSSTQSSSDDLATKEPKEDDTASNGMFGIEPTSASPSRLNTYEMASAVTSRNLAPPFGSTRTLWKPTLVSEAVTVVQIADPQASFVSISMMPQYAHLSHEQIRWADYNVLNPKDFGIGTMARERMQEHTIHPDNLFVDPSVVGQYPDLSHSVYSEEGIPYVVFMGSGDKLVFMQLIESAAFAPGTSPYDATISNLDTLPKLRKTRGSPPMYALNADVRLSDAPRSYSVLWRRSQTSWFVTPLMSLEQAKFTFCTRFSYATGQPWKLQHHIEGWKVDKEPASPWKHAELKPLPEWSRPTFLDIATHYEYIPLTRTRNDALRCILPISDMLRYWARHYRIVLADMPRSLAMVKLALVNDEPGTEDRILSLMEVAEWSRAIGNIKLTLEAVNAANWIDTTHPLPWLAKADLLNLARLQATNPRVEFARIEQALLVYRHFLQHAQRLHAQYAQQNPNLARDSQYTEALGDESNEAKGVTENVGGASPLSGSTGVAALAAATPSVAPPSLSSIMASLNPSTRSYPAVPSLLHMRRARWACGRLLQRLGRHEEAKVCYDDLLRRYFKRERLELTLDRCAVLLALKRPKEAAETIEHALKKELSADSHSPLNPSATPPISPATMYYEHMLTLKARAYLLLAAAHYRNSSLEFAMMALREHQRLDPFEPRAQELEKIIRKARSASKPDTQTRMRQHNLEMMRRLGPNIVPGAQGQVQPPGQGQGQVQRQGFVPGQGQLGPQRPLAPPQLNQQDPLQHFIVPLQQHQHHQRHAGPVQQQLAQRNPLQFHPRQQQNLPPHQHHLPHQQAQPPLPLDQDQQHRPLGAPRQHHEPRAQIHPVPHPEALQDAQAVDTDIDALQENLERDLAIEPRNDAAPVQEDNIRDAQLSDEDDNEERNITDATVAGMDDRNAVDDMDGANRPERNPRAAERRAIAAPSIAKSPLPSNLIASSSGATVSTPPYAATPPETLLASPVSSSPVAAPSSSSGQTNTAVVTSSQTPAPVSSSPLAQPGRLAQYRQYAPWETFSTLLAQMVDFSAMRRWLLPPTLFEQDCDGSNVFLPIDTLRTARAILESIRDLLEESRSPNPTLSMEEYAALIKDLEGKYFESLPTLRRHHIAFFVEDEIQRLTFLMDASFACSLLRDAFTLDATSLENPNAERELLAGDIAILSEPPSLPSSSAPSLPLPSPEHSSVSIIPTESCKGEFHLCSAIVSRVLAIRSPAATPRTFPLNRAYSWLDIPAINYNIPENCMTSVPANALFHLLSEHVSLSVVDRRGPRGQQILQAIGTATSHVVRIISVTKTTPPPLPRKPTLPPLPLHSPPNSLSSLLWIVIPRFSLPRVLIEGLELSRESKIQSLTFSAALDGRALPVPHVSLLVEVQLGNVYYSGTEQATPPPGYDSIAIVKRFTTITEADGTELLLPQNADSSAPLFRVFNQSQIGPIRYILHVSKD